MKLGYECIKPMQEELLAFIEKHQFESVLDFKGKSLDYFTSHTDLVRRQAERKAAQRAAAAKSVRSDAEWSGESFVQQSDSLSRQCVDAMSLLIKNGEIVTASERYKADIYCEGETITRIDRDISAPPGATVVDATGKFVFPGIIDPHVHIYLPFMGTYSKDTYETGSKAAHVGGTTTLIEMCCPSRRDDTLKGFELWMSKAAGKSACDFTFHMGVTKYDSATEAQLREIVGSGISPFKIFLAYKGAFGVDDTELYRTLALAKKLGVIVTAHCENETLVAERSAELLAAGKTDSGQHHESRPPPLVEAEGVHHLLTFAELTGNSDLYRPFELSGGTRGGYRSPSTRREG
jgi:Amidohydrolase family